jgi:hypothetical protein
MRQSNEGDEPTRTPRRQPVADDIMVTKVSRAFHVGRAPADGNASSGWRFGFVVVMRSRSPASSSPLKFTPRGRAYRVEGEAPIGRVFAG